MTLPWLDTVLLGGVVGRFTGLAPGNTIAEAYLSQA
jgi:hypothetical protein